MTTAMLVAALLVLVATGAALYHHVRAHEHLRVQLEAAEADLQHLQDTCARLAPAGVVHRLAADKALQGSLPAAERKVVTALFADLVGYTALSEQLEPVLLARVLNGYFQSMSDVIHEHRGHVSTFLGDGILAYFGALLPNPWQCNDSVHAALAMQEAIHDYNAQLRGEGIPPIAVGIGIHRGPGLAGLIGSRERMEYGFVGRTVNVAARVQALTRVHRVNILVTEALRAELDTRFELTAMPPEFVKGVAEPVITYAVGARRNAARAGGI